MSPMSPEQWREVRSLLEAALERREEERRAFLDAACPDPELRREVSSLLAVEAAAADFIETPVFDLHGNLPGGERAGGRGGPAPGTRIGRYRVVAEIGRGGMGAVYLAARADQAFEQRVAIKVLKRGVDTDEVVARFRAERQILAHLDHPNISRLIDGGSTEDGLPYLVMEHVEGTPIDDWCDERRLPVRARVELMRTVAAAVQFAHQNLVVHRDLKPGNVLVTAGGVPKLLDFGIAKLLAADGAAGDGDGAASAAETRLGFERFTPEYAAPEQVLGGPITTATDVYGLGALLYELLTGRPPRVVGAATRADAERAARQEIERPSTVGAGARAERGDAGRPRRELRGDLDRIALKALAADPRRRYASAEQLSEDLRRHLEGLPVRARGNSFAYRAGRLLRRHRWAAAGAALLVVLLAGFAVREAALKRRAEAARAQAQATVDFLVESLEQADPTRSAGREVTVRQMLASAVARIRSDDELAPPTRAELLDTMGRAHLGLGLYDGAEPLLEEALDLRRRELGGDHLQVAESHYRLFQLHHERGDTRAAEAHLREMLAIRRRRGEVEHANYAKGLNGLAQILERRGDLAEAERLHLEVLALKRRLLGDLHPDVATTLHNLAGVQLARGEAGAAAELYGQALEIRRRNAGGPDRQVASSLNGLAAALEAAGDAATAERHYREAEAVQRRLYGAGGHRSLAVTLNNLGALHLRAGDPAAAEPLLREALAIQDRLLDPGHPERATVLRNLAETLAAHGEPAAAEAPAREAVAIFERTQAPDHWRTADARSVLGGVLAALGRASEAEPLLTAGLDRLRETRGPASPYTREAEARLEKTERPAR